MPEIKTTPVNLYVKTGLIDYYKLNETCLPFVKTQAKLWLGKQSALIEKYQDQCDKKFLEFISKCSNNDLKKVILIEKIYLAILTEITHQQFDQDPAKRDETLEDLMTLAEKAIINWSVSGTEFYAAKKEFRTLIDDSSTKPSNKDKLGEKLKELETTFWKKQSYWSGLIVRIQIFWCYLKDLWTPQAIKVSTPPPEKKTVIAHKKDSPSEGAPSQHNHKEEEIPGNSFKPS